MQKNWISWSSIGGVALGLALVVPSYAALPDQETFEFVTRRYTLLLEEDRGGCGYYANLDTLTQNGTARTVSVLRMRGESGGSLCNGIFEFKVLSVDCAQGEVSYSDRIGSPATWEEHWHSNLDVAQMICPTDRLP
jgi:hypothetical protein